MQTGFSRFFRRALLAVLLWPATQWAALPHFEQIGNWLVMSNGNVRVEYNLTDGTSDFFWRNSRIIASFYSRVILDSGEVRGLSYSNRTYQVMSSDQVVVTATNTDLPAMKQYFTLNQENSFLTRVEMVGSALRANWMGPVVVESPGWVDISSCCDPRALVVPWDNDHYERYDARPLSGSGTSHEVAAFYDNTTRYGLVVGSVTHDTWKSGIWYAGWGMGLNELSVYGGQPCPWDIMEHGWVRGNTISSPVMFVGYGEDWRKTMEDYADANAAIVPRLPWTNGVPFGWNSWGTIQQSIDYARAMAVSDFFHTNLQPAGFQNQGTVYVNLDSYWSNLNDSQMANFVAHCHSYGQKVGLYMGPFVYWGNAASAPYQYVEGTTNMYTYADALLRDGQGNFQSNDGALAMDPTHPGTKLMISYYANRFLNWGIDYVKIDFLSHGAYEGVHWDTNVTTGVQAYHQGMRHLTNAFRGRVFISESIAPLFPYQYGHSRRIACDAFQSIDATEYTLNSVTYGWWLSGRLYQYNDPDHLVLRDATGYENQSRVISGAIAGTVFLNGDDLAYSALGRDLAHACLTKAGINEVARAGRPFRPIEGNTEWRATDAFVRRDGTTWCLAVFNYGNYSVTRPIDFARAGFPGSWGAVDLWTGAQWQATNSLSLYLGPKQARLIRLFNRPLLLDPHIVMNRFYLFTLTGDPGYNYAVEKTLNWTNWVPVSTVSNVTGQLQLSDPMSTSSKRYFYRARLLP